MKHILHVPEDIVREILKGLPVKSLIRFQCVCKYWKDLMKDPSFISDHLQQSNHRNPSLLFEYYGIPWHRHLYLLDCGLQLREVPKTPWTDAWGRIVGSSNGLLCVQIFGNRKSPPFLSLWNPSTKTVRRVPNNTDCTRMTAFGFSPTVNDYKIVRTYAKHCGMVNRVEAFSLNRGSWKEIDMGNLNRVKLQYETVTANGAIFWLGVKVGVEEDGAYDVQVVVSFDIAKEMFTVGPTPDLGVKLTLSYVKLMIYENKLGVLCNIFKNGGTRFDLWLLDESTWRWTKRSISISLRILHSRAIWRNEIVCEQGEKDKGRSVLYMMNLTTSELRRFTIPYRGSFYNVYNYVESLVSVGNNSITESCS